MRDFGNLCQAEFGTFIIAVNSALRKTALPRNRIRGSVMLRNATLSASAGNPGALRQSNSYKVYPLSFSVLMLPSNTGT